MSRRRIPLLAALGAAGVVAMIAGCTHAPRWLSVKTVDPNLVGRVLDDPYAAPVDLRPEDVGAPPVRTHLRPCCAFGTQLQATLGPVPIPFFSIGNLLGVEDLGPHRYDAGSFSVQGSSPKNVFSKENNGLVYTCRGGFIDTAHVRDYADWTIFLAASIARASETGAEIELPPEGGKRKVVIRPLPREWVRTYGLRRTAVVLAEWLAFQLSVWHEIATAYGWSSIDLYPEYLSAFSPEDLYSNALGIKIAGGLMMHAGGAATDALYDQNMDTWLRATIEFLKPVSAKEGMAAIRLVDGVWWDSKARLPNPRLVRRRNLDIGDEIVPWVVSRANNSPESKAWVDRECGGKERPLVLRRRESFKGTKFSKFLTYEVEVDVPDPFPFLRAGSKTITQDDFPHIIENVRARCIKSLGPGADRPEGAAE